VEDRSTPLFGHRVAHRGQSLVELAFILPMLLMLGIGIVDMGRAFYTSIAIQGAAEAGSLVAAEYNQSAAAVKAKIMASTNPDIFPFVTIQDSEITLTMDTSATGKDTEYSIVVTRNFQLLTPFIGSVVGSQALTLRSAVTGRRNCQTAFC
jgi:Flp pilus assembly protein TadG